IPSTIPTQICKIKFPLEYLCISLANISSSLTNRNYSTKVLIKALTKMKLYAFFANLSLVINF
ncbi:MAG: hypothetical protein ACLUBN_06765, partial [Campylobacter upsaliensis]